MARSHGGRLGNSRRPPGSAGRQSEFDVSGSVSGWVALRREPPSARKEALPPDIVNSVGAHRAKCKFRRSSSQVVFALAPELAVAAGLLGGPVRQAGLSGSQSKARLCRGMLTSVHVCHSACHNRWRQRKHRQLVAVRRNPPTHTLTSSLETERRSARGGDWSGVRFSTRPRCCRAPSDSSNTGPLGSRVESAARRSGLLGLGSRPSRSSRTCCLASSGC